MYNFNEKKLFRYTRSIHRIEREKKVTREKKAEKQESSNSQKASW